MKRPETTVEEIVRDYGTMVRRIAFSHESSPHLADELVQEIYIAIWRALPSFRGEASLKTFVARIATNRAVTHAVRAMRVPPASELSEEIRSSRDTPEEIAIANDRREILMTAVRRLPLAYRQPVMLSLEGLTLEEVAQVLGITANATAIRTSRAKQMLKQWIGEQP